MTPDEMIARMKDRRETLSAVLLDLEGRCQAVRGGIAEIDYLVEQFVQAKAEAATDDALMESITRLPPSDLSAIAFPPTREENLRRAVGGDIPSLPD